MPGVRVSAGSSQTLRMSTVIPDGNFYLNCTYVFIYKYYRKFQEIRFSDILTAILLPLFCIYLSLSSLIRARSLPFFSFLPLNHLNSAFPLSIAFSTITLAIVLFYFASFAVTFECLLTSEDLEPDALKEKKKCELFFLAVSVLSQSTQSFHFHLLEGSMQASNKGSSQQYFPTLISVNYNDRHDIVFLMVQQ